ncbi:helicase C-terminal domain-containing protein [Ascosphaera apis ARSEF 7405]|uniref:ATP-dependent DNA helicase n=1 Tax=Ascosphaera apis ARSEF 7405 TaxID=392613 RepID=A0A162IBY3_9EURO|nr:helicase C-terminal domain-containing protein [Ascosphaera apis ARSEF 7405]
MVDLDSDFGDLDEDLLQLTEEVEHASGSTTAAAGTQDGDSCPSAKRRCVGQSPFKKPQLPHNRPISARSDSPSRRDAPSSALSSVSLPKSATTWKQSQLSSWSLSPSRSASATNSARASNTLANRPAGGPQDSGGVDEDDDPDLAAAIKASLHDYNKQKTLGQGPLTPSKADSKNDATSSFHYDTDDIPDDVFDSPFQVTPAKTRPAFSSSNYSGQQNLRQTTLFGTTAPEELSATVSQSPCPSHRNEPPTHHKLNHDALGTWVYPTNLGTKRDYQFNITKKALFHNLLVALPTAGIPRSATTILTGETGPGLRAQEWNKKRVFFMTPQTFIADLTTGIADPKRIVLLVVDEAHRATGGYAYGEAVKFLERFNQSFRVLALTATPGKEVEGVQEVIDNLRISKIEIRSEQSLDIRQYVHLRNTEKHTFENTPEMARMLDLFSKSLKPVLDKLTSQNAFWSRDPLSITPYGLTLAKKKWLFSVGRTVNQGIKAMVNAAFCILSSLAHALDLLKYHGIRSFHRSMMTFKDSCKGNKGGKYRRMIHDNPNFQTMMTELEKMVSNPHFTGNPKMDYLKEAVLNHFLDVKTTGGTGEGNGNPDTRIMIFAKFRDSAEDIVASLKSAPMVKAHVFVGKAKAKNSEGMAQKRQLEVVKKFKEGVYNVLVATSVGEEGLDIGEVDLIICYDSSSSPISLLQRMGRTGRKREGNVILLFMKGKEEMDYVKALDNYLNMQKRIETATEFTFHTDKAPRILPKDVRPVVDERRVDVPPENLEPDDFMPKAKKGVKVKRPPKKFHMPDNVQTGFMTAFCLHNGGKTKPTTSTKTGSTRRKREYPLKQPVVEVADVPPDSAVFLSQREEGELMTRYRNIGGTSPQIVRPVNFNAFATSQRLSRPIDKIGHSNRTRGFIRMLRNMRSVPPDCDLLYREKLHPNDEFVVTTKIDDLTDDEDENKDSGQNDMAQLQSQTDMLAVGDSQLTMSQTSIPDLTTMFGPQRE